MIPWLRILLDSFIISWVNLLDIKGEGVYIFLEILLAEYDFFKKYFNFKLQDAHF